MNDQHRDRTMESIERQLRGIHGTLQDIHRVAVETTPFELQLFQIRPHNKDLGIRYYSNKASAKRMLRRLHKTMFKYTLEYGPDHWLFGVQQFVRERTQ